MKCLAALITALLILAATTSQAQAVVTTYRFSGVLPDDVVITGDMVSQVAKGETWMADVLVDLSATGATVEGFTLYEDTALSAEVVFSGGYSDTLSRGSNSVFFMGVYNNYPVSGTSYVQDGVAASLLASSSGAGLVLGVLTEDLNAMATDALPTFPTSFN